MPLVASSNPRRSGVLRAGAAAGHNQEYPRSNDPPEESLREQEMQGLVQRERAIRQAQELETAQSASIYELLAPERGSSR